MRNRFYVFACLSFFLSSACFADVHFTGDFENIRQNSFTADGKDAESLYQLFSFNERDAKPGTQAKVTSYAIPDGTFKVDCYKSPTPSEVSKWTAGYLQNYTYTCKGTMIGMKTESNHSAWASTKRFSGQASEDLIQKTKPSIETVSTGFDLETDPQLTANIKCEPYPEHDRACQVNIFLQSYRSQAGLCLESCSAARIESATKWAKSLIN